MGTTDLTSSEKLLKRALQHVSDYWIPVNRQLADKIQTSLANGDYDGNRSLLTKELNSDLGLFFGCIRELKELLAQRESNVTNSTNLTEILEVADLELVGMALTNFSDAPSVHILSEGEEHQLARLFESLISITTAQTLADGYDYSPGAAGSVAALRQLGFALIAWNYPTVYEEALSDVKNESHELLEDALQQRLGFSPLLLAARLAESWGLPSELVQATVVPTSPLYEEAHIISATHTTVSTICRVSEALARVQFDNLYPHARDEWENARKEVERRLGPQGIERIKSCCADACRTLLTTCPDIFRPGTLLDEETLSTINPSGNPFVARCEQSIQDLLHHLYRMITLNKPSEAGLRYLLHEIIPAASFSGGCVYTADPLAGGLIPQLQIGYIELRQAQPVPFSIVGEDPISLAFYSSEGTKPIVAENNRENLGSIISPFGRSQRLGVLYLELPLSNLRSKGEQHLLHFRAISHALTDCLGL